MKKLGYIVKEIEETEKRYRNSSSKLIKSAYNQYIEFIITEAEKSQQYDLCDYWGRLKNARESRIPN